ncbi:MAG TPA: hypothetical protein HA349_00655 [Methanotrichaceae archaeon]|nr:hypothetical protein [Methanotrichaceae archaeon]
MGACETKCDHVSCGGKEKIWHPHKYNGGECGLKRHHYCVKCGLAENVSNKEPQPIGHYMNALARLGRELKVAKVQMRLISQEMERHDLEDIYGMDIHQQDDLFSRIVEKYLNIPEDIVRKFL